MNPLAVAGAVNIWFQCCASGGLTGTAILAGRASGLLHLPGRQELHLGGFDEKSRLAGGVLREADGLEVAGGGQLAALPGEGGAALRQCAPDLDGDEVVCHLAGQEEKVVSRVQAGKGEND